MFACVCFGQLWFKNIVDLPYVSVNYQKTLGKSLQALTVATMKPVLQGKTPRMARRHRETVKRPEEKTKHHSPMALESNNILQLT
jgi:hypothetical protein